MNMNPLRQRAVVDSLREVTELVADVLRHSPEGQDALARAEAALAAAELPSSELEVHTVLVGTTGHVTRAEARVLDEHGYSRGEYGWLIHVGGDPENGDPISEISEKSQGLRLAIEVARRLGCAYLLLDRDANAIEGVPVYNW